MFGFVELSSRRYLCEFGTSFWRVQRRVQLQLINGSARELYIFPGVRSDFKIHRLYEDKAKDCGNIYGFLSLETTCVASNQMTTE